MAAAIATKGEGQVRAVQSASLAHAGCGHIGLSAVPGHNQANAESRSRAVTLNDHLQTDGLACCCRDGSMMAMSAGWMMAIGLGARV
jgi:hypothetical protein